MVAVPPILRGGDVARVIKCCAIRLSEQHRRHLVRGEVHDERALVELRQAEFLKPADGAGHQLVVLRLAADLVEAHAEHAIDFLERGEADLAEPLPERDRFRIAVLEPLEPRAPLVAKRRVLLRLLVEPHVEHIQVRDRVALERLRSAPALVRRDHQPELRAPVAEEVDADDAVAERAIDPVERVADHRRSHVMDAQVLGDVRRRELDDDGPAFAQVGMAELAFAPVRLRQRPGDERLAPDGEVDVRSVCRSAGDPLARLNLCRQLARGLRRIPLLRAGQGEARERVVAHRLVRRRRQQRLDRRFVLLARRTYGGLARRTYGGLARRTYGGGDEGGEFVRDLGGERVVHFILSWKSELRMMNEEVQQGRASAPVHRSSLILLRSFDLSSKRAGSQPPPSASARCGRCHRASARCYWAR